MKAAEFQVIPALLAFSMWTFSVSGQEQNQKLVTFEQFVNGSVPIKEAVIVRELCKTNGAVLEKEAWRFGLQNETWYFQRLRPDSVNSSMPLPAVDTLVSGASTAELWIVDDQNLQIVAKNVASGSLPYRHSEMCYNYILSAISLGVPRKLDVMSPSESPVRWTGLQFDSAVVSKRDRNHKEIATSKLTGQVRLGTNGLPALVTYPQTGQYPAGAVNYEYAPDTVGIPNAFTAKYADEIFHYKFVSLVLGSNDLAQTKGYTPSLFADMTRKRRVYFYTNDLPYEQRDGKSYPSFHATRPMLGQPPPELHGTKWFNTQYPLSLGELHGKVVLLDFWSVQCPDCIESMPKLEAFYQQFQKGGLVVIGVCLDWGSAARANDLLQGHGVTYPNMMDSDYAIADEHCGLTSWSYVCDAAPTYALVDKSGNLAWKSTESTAPTASQIENLLENKPAN
jgi:thiol-disulfide isomerase/thioredoxin